MDQLSTGKYYLNGTCVQYAIPIKKKVHETAERNYTNRSFQIGFKQRMKIYDAITLQNYQAAERNDFYHTFLTATFESGRVPQNPNNVFSDFLDKCRKQGFINYVWTRELTKVGTPHYHFTLVGPRKPINSKTGWSINKCWSDSRGYYSGNGIRSSINPHTGKSQMVIHSLVHARQYVAKYISKANNDQSSLKGRIYAISNDLQNCPPLAIDDAVGLATHRFYSNKRDLIRRDFCTIGGVDPRKSKMLYDQIQMENEIEREKLEKRMIESRLIPTYSKSDQKKIEFSQSFRR